MELIEIGKIHSPYDRKGERKPPKQGSDEDLLSQIEVYRNYKDGLKTLKEGDKILVLYWADMADREKLISDFVGHSAGKGVFSIRSPHRPNPILLSEVLIERIEDNILTVKGLEALDGSSLLDIKISIN